MFKISHSCRKSETGAVKPSSILQFLRLEIHIFSSPIITQKRMADFRHIFPTATDPRSPNDVHAFAGSKLSKFIHLLTPPTGLSVVQDEGLVFRDGLP